MPRPLLLLFALLPLAACATDPAAPTQDAGAIDDAFVSPDAYRTPDAWLPVDAGAIQTSPVIPAAAGACPDMTTSGMVTVSPAGIAARQVRIEVGSAAATMDGPLVFFWHGAGGSPTEADAALGDTARAAILGAGGIIVAPVHDPAAGSFPWFLTAGSQLDDLLVADEVVACAVASPGIDVHRIHVVGFSAGALHTTQMSFRRASYVASVVTYSGGLVNAHAVPPRDASSARFAAMILHGGAADVVVLNFQTTSEAYLGAMRGAGDFGFICNHGMGHTVPAAARDSAWMFLDAHRFGVLPRAYASGLPSGFYAPCALP